jgi:hypothetical protein
MRHQIMNASDLSTVIDQLAHTPRFVREAFNSVSSDDWDKCVEGVQFSLRQEVCHLRDVELEGYLVRVFRMAAEVGPVLSDLDGTRLARERGYEAQDPTMALSDFAALRALTVSKLRQLPPTAWARTGLFATNAPFDIRELTAMMLQHDEEHCAEISALLAAVG